MLVLTTDSKTKTYDKPKVSQNSFIHRSIQHSPIHSSRYKKYHPTPHIERSIASFQKYKEIGCWSSQRTLKQKRTQNPKFHKLHSYSIVFNILQFTHRAIKNIILHHIQKAVSHHFINTKKSDVGPHNGFLNKNVCKTQSFTKFTHTPQYSIHSNAFIAL